MKKILGLDLGTNSVGSALVAFDKEQETLHEIIHLGSRIIPMGDEKNAFEQGQKITKNEGRRMKRGSRRLNQRYKLRRNSLIKFLKLVGALNEEYDIRKDILDVRLLGKPYTDQEIYGLRAKAVETQISLQEFGRVLYHINQRRGYQPNRKERAQKENQEKTNYEVYNKTAIIQSVELTGEKKKNKDEYLVTLNDGISGVTLNPSFAAMVGKEMEVEIRKKTSKAGEITYSFGLPDPSDWQKKLDATEADLNESGLTPGQYFHTLILEHRKKSEDFRIRQHLVFRKRYILEFNAIWDQQTAHHPELNDETLKIRVIETIMPRNSPDKAIWRNKTLKEFVRDYIIFYQRKLRSQKKNIANCSFELDKRVTPVSHPIFQDFRVWQAINNLKYENELGELSFLSIEQKEKLYEHLSQVEELSKEKVAKLLDMEEESLRMTDRLPGNETLYQLNKGCRKAGIKLNDIASQPDQLELLWHILYSLEDEEEDNIINALCRNFSLSSEQAQKLSLIYFDKDWGSLSARAIKRILPLMKAGKYFSKEEIHPEIQQKINRLINGEEDETLTDKVRTALEGNKELKEFTGLPYWLAASLVYGKHTAGSEGDPYGSPDEIKPLPLHSLRNPVVEQVVNETLSVVKDIWKYFEKPDEIRIELPREMKQNAKERAKTYKNNKDREEQRKKAFEKIKNDPDFNVKNPTRKDVDRYLLWEEAKHYCIYTGKNIPKSAVFNGETDIDHILPRQRFFDDSFQNKVLVFRKANEEKGNMTAFEYMQQKDWDRYEADVKNRYYGKKKNFLLTKEIPTDFINRQLSDSRYIAKKVKELLERVCPGKVYVTSGTITDYLKNQWGLNEVFKKLMIPRFERLEKLCGRKLIEAVIIDNKKILNIEGFDKRIDHRHHALDALVVAVTKQGYIQQLNNLNQFFKNGELKNSGARNFKLPCPNFREMTFEKLEELIVSHKSRKRLLSTSINNYKKRNSDGKLVEEKQKRKVFAIRGTLHDEQPYGLVKQYARVKIDKALEDPEKIAVVWQKQAIQEVLAKNNFDLKKTKQFLKKHPLTDLKGEKFDLVSVFIEKHVKTYELKSITKKQLKNISNRKLAAELKEHAEKYGNDYKKAFSSDGLVEFNAKRKKPVYKVRVLLNGKLKQLSTSSDPNEKKYIKEGGNYCFVIYENNEGERIYDNVSFYDASILAREGQPIVERKEGYTHFTLHAGELVYVPFPDQSAQEINWKNLKEINSRIYKFIKGTGNQSYFIPHNIADILNKRKGFDKEEFGSQNSTEFVDEDSPRTKIAEKCIKIRVDRLGRIHPL